MGGLFPESIFQNLNKSDKLKKMKDDANPVIFFYKYKACRMNKTVGKRSDQFDKMLYGSSRSQQKIRNRHFPSRRPGSRPTNHTGATYPCRKDAWRRYNGVFRPDKKYNGGISNR